jgi:hypothetical protein
MEIFVKITCINRTPVYYEHKCLSQGGSVWQIIMVEKKLKYFAIFCKFANKYKNAIICKFAHTKIAKFCKFAKKIAI